MTDFAKEACEVAYSLNGATFTRAETALRRMYAEGFQAGLAKAAEIARRGVHQYKSGEGSLTNYDQGGSDMAKQIAEAILAAAPLTNAKAPRAL